MGRFRQHSENDLADRFGWDESSRPGGYQRHYLDRKLDRVSFRRSRNSK